MKKKAERIWYLVGVSSDIPKPKGRGRAARVPDGAAIEIVLMTSDAKLAKERRLDWMTRTNMDAIVMAILEHDAGKLTRFWGSADAS